MLVTPLRIASLFGGAGLILGLARMPTWSASADYTIGRDTNPFAFQGLNLQFKPVTHNRWFESCARRLRLRPMARLADG
jgi:hypothetical protein